LLVQPFPFDTTSLEKKMKALFYNLRKQQNVLFMIVSLCLIFLVKPVLANENISSQEQANLKIVHQFFASWPSGDIKKITSYLAEDTVYTGLAHDHQIENPVLKGKKAFADYWWSMIKNLDAQTVKVTRSSVIGNTVMTERRGSATVGGKTYHFHIGTIFYIVDGKIKTFTEYMMPRAPKYTTNLPEESHQYDFMVGDWDISTTGYDSKGNITGTGKGLWWAELKHDGRVLYENAVMFNEDGTLEANMPAMRTYSPKQGHWTSRHMFPLGGSDKSVCDNVGVWQNNEMHLNSTCLKLDGGVEDYARIRFFDIKNDSFSYTWESTKDKINWTTHALIKAKRRNIASSRPDQDTAKYTGNIPTESTQYNFLLGDWNIVKKQYDANGQQINKQIGKWWAKSLHGGRAIHDDQIFVDDKKQHSPGTQSLRTYSTKLGKWDSLHVQPLTDTGLCINNQNWLNKEMIGTSTCMNRNGEVILYKKSQFTNITNKGFDYIEERSIDNKIWVTITKINAKRSVN